MHNNEYLEPLDAAVSLGGDGTLLQMARYTVPAGVPAFGINFGKLGFLAEIDLPGMRKAISKLAQGNYTIERRKMLQATVIREGTVLETSHALNDFVLAKGMFSKLAHLRMYINGKPSGRYAADGLIISTATGSTAYSLSAGGPVVEPVAQTMVVCPICTHNMRFSSYVLSPEHTLTIGLERNGRKPVYLFVDESRGFALRSDDQVLVRKSKYTTKLVRLSEKSFCEIFAQKMLPGGFHDEK